VSASVNLPLHHKVQKFSPGTGSPGWSRKKGPYNGRGVVVVVLYSEFVMEKTRIAAKYRSNAVHVSISICRQSDCHEFYHSKYLFALKRYLGYLVHFSTDNCAKNSAPEHYHPESTMAYHQVFKYNRHKLSS